MQKYNLGQVLCILSGMTIYPVKVVEVISSESTNGVTYKHTVIKHDSPEEKFQLEFLQGKVFTDTAQVKQHILTNIAKSVSALIEKCEEDAESFSKTSKSQNISQAHFEATGSEYKGMFSVIPGGEMFMGNVRMPSDDEIQAKLEEAKRLEAEYNKNNK